MITTIAISFMVGYALGTWITYCNFRRAILKHNQGKVNYGN